MSDAAGLVTAGRADLAGIVPRAATLPGRHQARVLGALRVERGNRMPAATVRTVNLVAKQEGRILGGVIALHLPILEYQLQLDCHNR
jgi:hypothetical protein